VIVGVNRFTVDENIPTDILKVDPALREEQTKRLSDLRSSRDSSQVESALASLRSAAQGKDNLTPPIMNAVKARATLGEICGVLRDIFGEYTHVAAG
jgi:methylmalonyl-CoA mutase N-terminal domain/subunit